MPDEFRTIAKETRIQLTVRGSLFVATALPVSDVQQALRGISTIRAEFNNATHNCFAYKLGHAPEIVRMSDDGEPAGTAGRPILASIKKRSLTNLLVVVTRYFGGTKLGVPGLRRAYAVASDRALAAAEQIMFYVTETITASFPHAHISTVMHAVSRAGAKITDTTYDEEVHLTVEIRKSKVEELKEVLIAQTSGNIRLKSNIVGRQEEV